jgi:hypothetical protein
MAAGAYAIALHAISNMKNSGAIFAALETIEYVIPISISQ